MRRHIAFAGAGRSRPRAVTSLACLVFVLLLALAFWAGAVWIFQFLVRVSSL
jgi:hypothetical protein